MNFYLGTNVLLAVVLLLYISSVECADYKQSEQTVRASPYIWRPRYNGKRSNDIKETDYEYEQIKDLSNKEVSKRHIYVVEEKNDNEGERKDKRQLWGRRHRFQIYKPNLQEFKKQEPDVYNEVNALYRRPLLPERFGKRDAAPKRIPWTDRFGKRENTEPSRNNILKERFGKKEASPYRRIRVHQERFGKREKSPYRRARLYADQLGKKERGPQRTSYQERFGKKEVKPRFYGMNYKPRFLKKEIEDGRTEEENEIQMNNEDFEDFMERYNDSHEMPTIRIGDQDGEIMRENMEIQKDSRPTWGRFGKRNAVELIIVRRKV